MASLLGSAVERGDPTALRAFRNLVLGLPGTSGTADIDKLFELREDTISACTTLEQVTAAGSMFNQIALSTSCSDSLPTTTDCWVLELSALCSEIPSEDEVWATLAAKLAQTVRRAATVHCRQCRLLATSPARTCKSQCSKRRWWMPCVVQKIRRSAKPIARRLGPTGICGFR